MLLFKKCDGVTYFSTEAFEWFWWKILKYRKNVKLQQDLTFIPFNGHVIVGIFIFSSGQKQSKASVAHWVPNFIVLYRR